jgi:peptide/nickel transport system ATP-binding protein
MAGLLTISDLHLRFRVFEGLAHVLNGIGLRVEAGERVAIVGESGCGKSLTARVVLGLIHGRQVAIEGRVEFEGKDLLHQSQRQWRQLRGRRISLIFQDPSAALNPVFTIGDQLATVVMRGGTARRRKEALALAREALTRVAISDPDRVLASYPFQLSGGLNQRVLITMALINRPALVIADEPGTALDVTVQAQTLRLMRALTLEAGAAVLLITHNLGVVREFAGRVYVMYAGQVVEEAPAATLFAAPKHPYTRALLAAVPKLSGGALPSAIEGDLPSYLDPPSGCRFRPRCGFARAASSEPPPVVETAPGQKVAFVLDHAGAGHG